MAALALDGALAVAASVDGAAASAMGAANDTPAATGAAEADWLIGLAMVLAFVGNMDLKGCAQRSLP